MKNRKGKTALIILLLIIALLLILLVWQQQKKADSEKIADAGKVLSAEEKPTFLEHRGKKYQIRHGLDTVLLIGTDDIEGKAGPSPEDGNYYNYDLADFLVLLVVDNEAGTVRPIQINRDTMTEVPWLSVNGLVGGTNEEQICFAHTYGSGGEDSCRNTVNTVSAFLCGAPIDGYISVTMDAIPILNDLIGGVTVSLAEDLPSLGDGYTKGTAVTLKGQNALKFVRYRDTERTDSNMQRMGRHRQYMDAFLQQARSAVQKDADIAYKALEKTEGTLITEMSGNAVAELTERICDYEVLPVSTYSGTYTLGEFAEFYADEEAVWESVREAYCAS